MALYHFAACYAVMYALAQDKPAIFGKYPDWARVQILVWYSCCLDDPWTRDLIWVNAVGGFLASHFLYGLTRYAWLDSMGKDLFKNIVGYEQSGMAMHLAVDLLHQGAPALFAYGVRITDVEPRPPAPPYLWLITAVPQVVYGYLLTGQWGLKPFYGASIGPWPDDGIVALCVLSGHFAAFLLTSVL